MFFDWYEYFTVYNNPLNKSNNNLLCDSIILALALFPSVFANFGGSNSCLISRIGDKHWSIYVSQFHLVKNFQDQYHYDYHADNETFDISLLLLLLLWLNNNFSLGTLCWSLL